MKMSEPLRQIDSDQMELPGLMLSAEGSPVSHSRAPQPGGGWAKMMTATSGLRCFDLYGKRYRDMSLPRMLLTSSAWHSKRWFLTWRAQATKHQFLKFRLVPSDSTTGGTASGFVATPTATANQASPSMMKHPGCRGIDVSPETWERRMGFPQGWTDLKPSETQSSPKSQKSSEGQ